MRRHVIMCQQRFSHKILDGKKVHTIRPVRKRLIYPGDILDLRQWYALPYRSKQQKIAEKECVSVQPIHINETFSDFMFLIGSHKLTKDEWPQFSRNDGFDCTTDMLDFFRETHGLPFNGILITWK